LKDASYRTVEAAGAPERGGGGRYDPSTAKRHRIAAIVLGCRSRGRQHDGRGKVPATPGAQGTSADSLRARLEAADLLVAGPDLHDRAFRGIE